MRTKPASYDSSDRGEEEIACDQSTQLACVIREEYRHVCVCVCEFSDSMKALPVSAETRRAADGLKGYLYVNGREGDDEEGGRRAGSCQVQQRLETQETADRTRHRKERELKEEPSGFWL